MAMMVLRSCQKVEGGLPKEIQAKMMFNIIIDAVLGICPVLVDIADAVFHANTRNAVVLERYLRDKGMRNIKSQGHLTPPVDPTDPHVFDQQIREEDGPPPQYSAHPTQGAQHQQTGMGQSGYPRQQAPTQPEQSGSGWFGGFGSKKKQQQTDLERGDRGQDLQRAYPQAVATDPQRTNTLQKNRQ